MQLIFQRHYASSDFKPQRFKIAKNEIIGYYLPDFCLIPVKKGENIEKERILVLKVPEIAAKYEKIIVEVNGPVHFCGDGWLKARTKIKEMLMSREYGVQPDGQILITKRMVVSLDAVTLSKKLRDEIQKNDQNIDGLVEKMLD